MTVNISKCDNEMVRIQDSWALPNNRNVVRMLVPTGRPCLCQNEQGEIEKHCVWVDAACACM